MELYVDLNALYSDLEKVQFDTYLDTNFFNRQLTALGIQSSWAAAHQMQTQRLASNRSSWEFDLASNNKELLMYFLNDLYLHRRAEFCRILCRLLGDFIAQSTEYVVIDAILADLDVLGMATIDREKIVAVWKRHDTNLLLKARNLEDFLLRVGRGHKDDVRYSQLLDPLLAIPDIKELLPEIVVNNRRMSAYWPAIQAIGGYQQRDTFIHQAFRLLIEHLEQNKPVMESTVVISERHIQEQWHKALERVTGDPEGAITMARTLLETVCKHVLDSAGQTYEDNGDVIRLYKTAARVLNLSPDQHGATNFKQILTGASAVIDGLAGLRNSLGDAHGRSHSSARPAMRHAQLAVNLSGSLSQFLLQTLENQSAKSIAQTDGDSPSGKVE